MYIKQFYTNCLSEATYYIESNGESAIIDPLRDFETYLEFAKERNTKIKYIFETHFHADFVSGHIDLAKATGATIVYGAEAKTNFECYKAKDNETLLIGNLQLKVLHTPGHTLESVCYLLHDENNQPHAIFTGDTLFIGDVGRPDLAQKGDDLTMEDLAGTLYDSLQSKIITLPDAVIVFPAHGAGSSCGKNLSKETQSTIGEQKQHNYALQSQTRAEFIKAVTEGLSAPPKYFPINVALNKNGYESITTVVEKGMTALDVLAVKQALKNEDTIILDTRAATTFTQGFIPTSIFIGLENRYAEWAGSLLSFDKPIIIVADKGKEKEAITRLTRVGLDNVIGYLKGGFIAWQIAGEPIDMIVDIEADELAMDLPHDERAVVIDVRTETEYGNGHIEQASNIPLPTLTDPLHLAAIEENDNGYLYCGGGYRSVIAASLFKRQGVHNLRNVLGGWSSIKKIENNFKIVTESAVVN